MDLKERKNIKMALKIWTATVTVCIAMLLCPPTVTVVHAYSLSNSQRMPRPKSNILHRPGNIQFEPSQFNDNKSYIYYSRCVKKSATSLCMQGSKEESEKMKTSPITLGSSTDENIELAVVDESQKVYSSAIIRTLNWVAAAAMFGLGIWNFLGRESAEEFFAGYLIEQSLSVDNLFVFLLLFDYFKVPLTSQDRVLNWGIYGAFVMRAIMICLGAVALQQFHPILLVFAGILIFSSVKVLFPGDEEDEEDNMSDNKIVQFSRKLVDSVDTFDGDRFFTFVNGVKKATPLFICMIAVEISDVVFAVDSIPAVFGVTESPLIVFTSNMFAIMGLRSLYTILSKAASDLEYLEPAVAVVLAFIGGKMIAEYFGYNVPTEIALAVVATLLSGGVGLSVWQQRQNLENEAV